MEEISKNHPFSQISQKKWFNVLIACVIAIIFFGGLFLFESKAQSVEKIEAGFLMKPNHITEATEEIENNAFIIIQGNSFSSVIEPFYQEPKITQRLRVIITGYSSSPQETDDTPFVTAAGTQVREGVIANNLLPFGTKIKIPEIYGNKIFVVEDRMHWKKGYYHIDVWFPSYWQALSFGAKRTYIEVLEN